jgi:signal transduction histidine kinase
MPVLAPPSYCARCGSSDRKRRRLERDLHDGAQQRLVTLPLQLRLLADRVEALGGRLLVSSPPAAGTTVGPRSQLERAS